MREPTNEEQRLMIVGGFETLEEYLQWMATPLDPAIVDALEEATEAGYLEDELLEEIRLEAEGPDPDEIEEEEYFRLQELEDMEEEEAGGSST